MEERGVAPPFPLLPETPPPSSGAPAKIHPFPPRRLVCAAALPPSPYTKKEEGVCGWLAVSGKDDERRVKISRRAP